MPLGLKPPMKRYNLMLCEDTIHDLQLLARERRTTVSALVRLAAEKLVANNLPKNVA